MRPEHTLEDSQRDAEAARLRSSGFTYREIAARVECSPGAAHARVQRALAAVPAEAVHELRRIEEARLDDLWKVAWRVATRDHVTVSHGKVILDAQGEPLLDDAPKLHAVLACLRIQERRARLFGLDEPTKTRIEVVSEDTVDQAIRELEAELAERDPEQVG